MGNALRKVGDFAYRHQEFLLGLAVGLAVPVVRTKLRGVQLPIQVEASASIDTGQDLAA